MLKYLIYIISENIPSYPDGYLYVKLKDNSRIALELNIASVAVDSPLYYGVSKLIDIPDSLKVESIVIQ